MWLTRNCFGVLSCASFSILEQTNMCSVNTVVSSLLIVGKEFNSNKSSDIHYL